MTLRRQIFARIGSLLLVITAVVLLSEALGKRVRDALGAVTDYHLPLSALVESVHSQTDAYEITLLRALDANADPAETRARLETMAAAIRTEVTQAENLLDRSIADSRNSLHDRLDFARARGGMQLSRHSLDDYLASGIRAIDVWDEQGTAAAEPVAAELTKADGTLDPFYEERRRELLSLVTTSVAEIYRDFAAVSLVSLALLAATIALALWRTSALVTNLVGRIQSLRSAVDSISEGRLDVALPPAAEDEIGDLTRSVDGLVTGMRREAHTAETFGRFLDPQVAERLRSDSSGANEYAERRPATILFADIAGFSGISEILTAESLVRLLNRVFSEAAAAIQSKSGVVDKYIGDAIMAFFAPPFARGDEHAAAACEAALDHLAALERIAPELADLIGLRRGAPNIAMRVGIATGPVVMGTVGADTARSFTVIGDSVNAASRLTGVNRVYGTSIAVSAETRRLAAAQIEAREIDTVYLSGKSEPVTFHEVLGRAGSLGPEDQERMERYAKALASYRARDFREAAAGFAECLRLSPTDGPAKLMAARSRALAEDPPPESWDGVFYLGSK